jgi:hypothetical protein
MFDVSFNDVLDEFLAQLTGEDGIRLQEAKDARNNEDVALKEIVVP